MSFTFTFLGSAAPNSQIPFPTLSPSPGTRWTVRLMYPALNPQTRVPDTLILWEAVT